MPLLVSSSHPSAFERYSLGIKAKCLIHPLTDHVRDSETEVPWL